MLVLLTCFLIAGCLMSSITLCASLSSRAVNKVQRSKVNSNMLTQCNRTRTQHWVVVLKKRQLVGVLNVFAWSLMNINKVYLTWLHLPGPKQSGKSPQQVHVFSTLTLLITDQHTEQRHLCSPALRGIFCY